MNKIPYTIVAPIIGQKTMESSVIFGSAAEDMLSIVINRVISRVMIEDEMNGEWESVDDYMDSLKDRRLTEDYQFKVKYFKDNKWIDYELSGEEWTTIYREYLERRNTGLFE